MGQCSEFDVDGIHTYRYESDGDYALLICHGGGGWGGMYGDWAIPFRDKYGPDIWSWDQVGFGQTGKRGYFDAPATYDAMKRLIAEIRKHHDKPIFTLGSSFGCLMATSSLCIDELAGAIAFCSYLVTGGPSQIGMRQMFAQPAMEAFVSSPLGQACWIDLDQLIDWEKNYGDREAGRKIKENPQHLSKMHLSGYRSLAMWDPPKPLAQNTKPYLMMVAENDPMLGGVENVRKNFETIGGPTELMVKEGSPYHQIMFFESEWFSSSVDSWCRKIIAQGAA